MPTPARPVRALAAGLPVAASAALAPQAAAATEDEGLFRLAHLSPDTPAGDVYVDSVADPGVRPAFPAVGYGTLSDHQEVPAGAYAVSMLPVGAPPGAPPILSATVDVAPGSARTVAGLGPASGHVEVPGGPATLTVTPDGGPAVQRTLDAAGPAGAAVLAARARDRAR